MIRTPMKVQTDAQHFVNRISLPPEDNNGTLCYFEPRIARAVRFGADVACPLVPFFIPESLLQGLEVDFRILAAVLASGQKPWPGTYYCFFQM